MIFREIDIVRALMVILLCEGVVLRRREIHRRGALVHAHQQHVALDGFLCEKVEKYTLLLYLNSYG